MEKNQRITHESLPSHTVRRMVKGGGKELHSLIDLRGCHVSKPTAKHQLHNMQSESSAKKKLFLGEAQKKIQLHQISQGLQLALWSDNRIKRHVWQQSGLHTRKST